MPYIKQEERKRYDDAINEIVSLLVNKLPGDNSKNFSVGDLNYIISSIVWKLFYKSASYTTGNNLIGVLESVKQEFYRRPLSEYEDVKIIENGDIR